MTNSRKRRSYKWAIILLAIALLVVCGVIIFKQREYAAGNEFYEGLRGFAGSMEAWL